MADKKARVFDMDSVFAAAKVTAAERSRATFEKLELEHTQGDDDKDVSEEEDVPTTSGGSVPSRVTAVSVVAEDDDEDADEGPEDEDADEGLEEMSKSLAADVEKRRIDFWLPDKNEAALKHGSKPITAIALDPSGARVASGGYDYDVKLWDFGGMDASLRSFREFRPCESHQIKTLAYNTGGEKILVVAGNQQAKVYDRDGYQQYEAVKGYPYIRDQVNTKGHTGTLHGGDWNPKDREEFITISADGTLRIWKLSKKDKQVGVIKTKAATGLRATPTCCSFNRDGSLMSVGCQDGSIQMWDRRKNTFVNTAHLLREAHKPGDMSCLAWSYDNNALASRGPEDTLKLWDIRTFKKPVGVAENLPNLFMETECCFSPNDKMVLTGVSSVGKKTGPGFLSVHDRTDLTCLQRLEMSDSSVIRCLWHPKLNQIVVSCADGTIKILYDEDKSLHGAKMCVSRGVRAKKVNDFVAVERIIAPFALQPKRGRGPRTVRAMMNSDMPEKRKPLIIDSPIEGRGEGGRIAVRGQSLHQYIIQQMEIRPPCQADTDIRGAILKHDAAARHNPLWIAPAYVYSGENVYQEDDAEEKEKKKAAESDEPAWKKSKV